ncbi:hypothetical protein DTO063F5_2647 [Paecilomyces variotii]|nr:hypothetical protein DTO063F5_2647 [Paecilomyces variotii]
MQCVLTSSFTTNAFHLRSTATVLFPRRPLSRSISITCQGEPIRREQLFEYTNGRFLVNEARERARRYAEFNVDALCSLVSSLPSISSPISKIDKMEGGFNKALLMTAENGKEVIAKIPLSQIVPPKYVTESEAATLDFVDRYTSIPVCKVLAWSSEISNPVGSEYIIMEKAPGRQLIESWGDMDLSSRFKLIHNLAQMESSLASRKFPGYGSLYFRDTFERDSSRSSIAMDDDDDTYCIGPYYHEGWFPRFGNHRDDAGPWTNLTDFSLSMANRGIWHVSNSNHLTARGPHYGSKDEHIQTLKNTQKIIPILAEHPTLQRFSTPILWHSDLHLGNIFVSNTDPTVIVNIIDWQYTSILPSFTQVQWPEFLNPPENYQVGMIKPDLPATFNHMDEDEKEYALLQRDKAMLSKRYEAALAKYHYESFLALIGINRSVQHLLSSCERTYKDGIVPHRDSLLRISQTWEQVGLPGSCPFEVSIEGLEKHAWELERYTDWCTLWGYTRQILCIDKDGWVSPRLDFDKVKERHDELFELYMLRESEEMSEDEARSLWFYVERE